MVFLYFPRDRQCGPNLPEMVRSVSPPLNLVFGGDHILLLAAKEEAYTYGSSLDSRKGPDAS